VTNANSNTVSVINTINNNVAATINVGEYPAGIAVAGTNAYVTNANSNTVSVINTINNNVIGTVNVGSYPAGIAVAGTNAYVCNANSNTVTVINTINNNVIGTINVGEYPAVISVIGTEAHVTNLNSNTITVINTINNNVIATMPATSVLVPSSGQCMCPIPVPKPPCPTCPCPTCPSVPKPKCPVANFSSKPICAVKFTDLSKDANKWYWTFGDGKNSTEQNPLHVYNKPGNYTVNLTVSSKNCTVSKSSIVSVCICPKVSPGNDTKPAPPAPPKKPAPPGSYT
jgi:YVTN family beta-propeller protein